MPFFKNFNTHCIDTRDQRFLDDNNKGFILYINDVYRPTQNVICYTPWNQF